MNTKGESSMGYLKIRTVSAGGAFPVTDALAIIIDDQSGTTLYSLLTDTSGLTKAVPLPAPERSLSQAPIKNILPYSTYTLQISKEGYLPISDYTVPVFDGITSLQVVNLIPKTELDPIKPLIGSGAVITPGYPALDANTTRSEEI